MVLDIDDNSLCWTISYCSAFGELIDFIHSMRSSPVLMRTPPAFKVAVTKLFKAFLVTLFLHRPCCSIQWTVFPKATMDPETSIEAVVMPSIAVKKRKHWGLWQFTGISLAQTLSIVKLFVRSLHDEFCLCSVLGIKMQAWIVVMSKKNVSTFLLVFMKSNLKDRNQLIWISLTDSTTAQKVLRRSRVFAWMRYFCFLYYTKKFDETP